MGSDSKETYTALSPNCLVASVTYRGTSPLGWIPGKKIWCPDKNRDLFLEAYASALEEKIFRESNLKEKCHRNLTKEEQKALEDLRSYDDIVIKQADKGSAVVVMDKERYVTEATRQLGDSAVYVSL